MLSRGLIATTLVTGLISTVGLVSAQTVSPVPSAYPGSGAAVPSGTCPGYTVCPDVHFRHILRHNHDAEVLQDDITKIETQTLAQIGNTPLPTDATSVANGRSLLGKAIFYDRSLSVNGVMACATCHSARTGFTGGISVLNNKTVSYVGAVGDRTGLRRAMTHSYAPFAPVLSYQASSANFVGGNFWDERATGLVTGNPAGDQALGPPLSPFEMANPDAACVVYHLAQAPYRALYEFVWGAQSFAVTWPAETEQVCGVPGSTNDANPTVLTLSATDRAQVTTTFYNMGLSLSAYEASSEVSPFTSKFDFVQQGKDSFTSTESFGYELFEGPARCSQCHATGSSRELFTNFSAFNIGVPRNTNIPFLTENAPDSYGYTANPAGPSYVDQGVGGFLATSGNPAWEQLAPQFVGTFQVPTLRNVAAMPRSSFIKSYMHNGYFKSLLDVVHFYNTRDTLPTCPDPLSADDVIGQTCWPAPEVSSNIDHTRSGNLGLSPTQEQAIVAFLETLTDGYTPPAVTPTTPAPTAPSSP